MTEVREITTAIVQEIGKRDARIYELEEALIALHSCHRAFSNSENWTALDDEAREFAEAAIAKATTKRSSND
jgi:hypothetical protein